MKEALQIINSLLKDGSRRLKGKNKKTIHQIFKAKQNRRKELAKLPIEKKVEILVKLQKMAIPILSERGIKRKAWCLR